VPKAAVRLLVVIALAAAAAGCGSSDEDTRSASARDETPTTAATTLAPTTLPSTTSTTSVYGWLGDEVGISATALGMVTWHRTQAVPLDLLWEADFPGPGYSYGYELEGISAHAREVTGRCLQIHDVPSGYLGMGPCPNYWEGRGNEMGGWFAPFDHPWMRGIEVWFSPDGVGWELMTDTAFGPSAAVMADPFVVAEYGGQWVVVGWADVDSQSDLPEEQLAAHMECGCMPPHVPIGATPAAWISEDLVTWIRLPIDFAAPGADTWLTSVAAGEAGWVIFGTRRSDGKPRTAEWAGWVSTDGIEWEELPMKGLHDDPCRPLGFEHCGRIQAHVIEDAIVVYAWTYDTPANPPFGGNGRSWTLLIGEL
jgi:hypothetical protein